jgi:hypothetical protein
VEVNGLVHAPVVLPPVQNPWDPLQIKSFVRSGDIQGRFWETENTLPMLGLEFLAVQPVFSLNLRTFKNPDI